MMVMMTMMVQIMTTITITVTIAMMTMTMIVLFFLNQCGTCDPTDFALYDQKHFGPCYTKDYGL